ncbi:biotin--[acetyl-CoA-carboxylase] ligase [Peptococcaceae bacterium]|nr:biotin--[acetyl-CoA-carboxylase] ligase [Peptococcaceae bacterium]
MKDKILDILKRHYGEWVSGERICKDLNISRTAVWKKINALKEEGYEIETKHHMGYRLVRIPDLLLPYEIKSSLDTKYIGREVVYYDSIDSTNDAAKEMAERRREHGTVVVTEKQTRGKGRMGRRWVSKACKDVLFSVILYPKIGLAQIAQISMLAVVAVAEALERNFGVKSGIKWPNDLLIDAKKVCGVLLEISAEADCVRYVVLGIGINVNSDESDWPNEIIDRTTSLKLVMGENVSRVKVIRAVLEELELWYEKWRALGFEPILRKWRTWCVSQKCYATVKTLEGEYNGWIEGVNDEGALILRLDDGTKKVFLSADVSLRSI